MEDPGEMLSFFLDIYIRVDTRVNISFSIRPVTTKYVKWVHLGELNHLSH